MSDVHTDTERHQADEARRELSEEARIEEREAFLTQGDAELARVIQSYIDDLRGYCDSDESPDAILKEWIEEGPFWTAEDRARAMGGKP